MWATCWKCGNAELIAHDEQYDEIGERVVTGFQTCASCGTDHCYQRPATKADRERARARQQADDHAQQTGPRI